MLSSDVFFLYLFLTKDTAARALGQVWLQETNGANLIAQCKGKIMLPVSEVQVQTCCNTADISQAFFQDYS